MNVTIFKFDSLWQPEVNFSLFMYSFNHVTEIQISLKYVKNLTSWVPCRNIIQITLLPSVILSSISQFLQNWVVPAIFKFIQGISHVWHCISVIEVFSFKLRPLFLVSGISNIFRTSGNTNANNTYIQNIFYSILGSFHWFSLKIFFIFC